MTPLAPLLALSLFASPFKLDVQSVETNGEHLASVAIIVPAGHKVYAKEFAVEPAEAVVAPKADLPDDGGVFTNNFAGLWRITGKQFSVKLQGCDDTTCFMPEEHTFAIEDTRYRELTEGEVSEEEHDWLAGRRLNTAGGLLSLSELENFLTRSKHSSESKETSLLRDPLAYFSEKGIGLTLLAIFIGGILLNLTPCVLPMIPVNLAVIGGGFARGCAYGLGIVVAYGGAGWAVVRCGAMFGTLQSSPWFNVTVAGLFLFFALAMFGLFPIDFTRFRKGGKSSGIFAAFITGAASAILAGACVAPVVLSAVLLASTLYSQGNSAAQFIPFVLGLGMAAPWPFAGLGISWLPKPGRWMNLVKVAFGVFLLYMASHYTLLALGDYLPAREFSVAVQNVKAGDYTTWQTLMESAKGKPVFVDFWATWCNNCRVAEKRLARSKELNNWQVLRVQVERPEDAKEMLEAFHVKGLPVYATLVE